MKIIGRCDVCWMWKFFFRFIVGKGTFIVNEEVEKYSVTLK